MTYLALLRGVNVGGKNKLPMATLRQVLEAAGFSNVRTYIQSGNVFIDSDQTDCAKLEAQIAQVIADTTGVQCGVAVFTHYQWQQIIASAPTWWGNGKDWKHNLLVMLRPYDMEAVQHAYGELKPDIERMQIGEGVVYQSLSWDSFGKTTGGKLASNPIYKLMTVRNYNTATKLLKLF